MLIEVSLSEITLAGWVPRLTSAQSDVMLIIFMMLGWKAQPTVTEKTLVRNFAKPNLLSAICKNMFSSGASYKP